MSASMKRSIRWACIWLAAASAAVALLWTASAIAQTPPPAGPAVSPWLTPTAVYGGLTILAGAIGWVFRWSAGQDKRIDAAATKDELRTSVASMRDAVSDLGKIVTSAQSRDACALHRQQETSALADLEREVSARLTVDERKIDRLLERLDGIAASTRGVDEIRQMVSQLYQAGGFTPLPAPRPIPRQPTQPPKNETDEG